jgi:hypothetical protein
MAARFFLLFIVILKEHKKALRMAPKEPLSDETIFPTSTFPLFRLLERKSKCALASAAGGGENFKEEEIYRFALMKVFRGEEDGNRSLSNMRRAEREEKLLLKLPSSLVTLFRLFRGLRRREREESNLGNGL